MFLTLLAVTLAVAFATAAIIARVFSNPIDRILSRIIADDISSAWRKYLTFAIYVTGVSGGVRIWDLEKYITPERIPKSRGLEGTVDAVAKVVELTTERWILEVYRTLIGTLQSVAWMLLVFFLFALIAYVVVRFGERRAEPKKD
ncbi:MAG TPA: hypothetical protein QGF95_07025 [Candidatus Latescibacteria bacterium]|jgi:hypothetical protein|nr:hypothetical protein [Candidatus Latescibacterota bacterium]